MIRVLALIQARVNSSRLPRKSLAIIGARASVFHVWKRAQAAVGYLNAYVVCPADDAGDFGAVLPRDVVMPVDGDEPDVLGRLAHAASRWTGRYAPDIIVRLTADCPFVDPEGIRAVVQTVERGADYATLTLGPNGLDAEAFTYDLLMRAHAEATDPADREHVTRWMQPGWYAHTYASTLPRYRWTLDTADDLEWFREVAKEIDCTPPHPTVPELLALMERRPDLVRYDGETRERMSIERVRVARAGFGLDPTAWV